jgi:hypothetical protein
MMDSRIHIKMGSIEVEYEGNEGFIKENLLNLLTSLSELFKEAGMPSEATPSEAPQIEKAGRTPGKIEATTGTIAAKLGCTSGSDLVIAAAARLTIVSGLKAIPRTKLLEEMKSASAYYKQTYGKHLSEYLQSLIKAGKLVESAKDTYALSAPNRKELEAKLAQQGLT